MRFDMLLAKSYPEVSKGERVPTYARLVPHLRAVERAGVSIVEAAGELILRHMGLDADPWLSRLERALRAACLCHDLGKANDGFQKMVRGRIPPTQQPVRHELLSALLLAQEGPVREWTLSLLSDAGEHTDGELLLDCVIAAIGGHHLKLDEEWNKASSALREGGCGLELCLMLEHPDMGGLFKGKGIGNITYDLVEDKKNFLGSFHLPFKLASNRWRDRLKKQPEWWRFAAALKALLTASDVAGSAMLPEKEDIRRWVHATLSRRVNAEQMKQVVRERLKGAAPRPFQAAIGQSEGRVTLVEAGCGSGKTAAAYLWAAKHADGKKLFFCYPTTGTATEGFRGYVHETEIEAKLIHSRAIVDLDGIAEVRHDEEHDEHLLRINSLSAWSPQVVICTADTVLALVRNNRRGLYNSPALLSASFVFDELHAYDGRMFEAVLALIKALTGASFLLMTASLPKSRKDFLLKELGPVMQVPTPRKLEELPRYLFQRLADENRTGDIARAAVAKNLKVLWICNTVSRAQQVSQQLKDAVLPVETYHSRFKYEHRVERHRSVINGFGRENSKAGLVAVTTQVAEMSLDLDADVLITEVAPVSALIQRLGRLNRRVTEEAPGSPRTAYFLMPEKVAPYRESDFEMAQRWLDELTELGRPLSQADLAEQFEAVSTPEELRLDTRTEWLDSGWFALPGPVRDPGVSASVILPEDESACRADSKLIVNKAIPMNFEEWRGMQGWKELKGNLIAPPGVIIYDEETGARWL
jgi:CRISPR-associated endonuclease/helicase Cas3